MAATVFNFPEFTTTIGGFEYKTRALGGNTGRKVFMRGVKAGGIKDMPEADLDAVLEVFQKNSKVKIGDEWKPLEDKAFFDIHFAGRVADQFKFLAFCWENNFPDAADPKEPGAQ